MEISTDKSKALVNTAIRAADSSIGNVVLQETSLDILQGSKDEWLHPQPNYLLARSPRASACHCQVTEASVVQSCHTTWYAAEDYSPGLHWRSGMAVLWETFSHGRMTSPASISSPNLCTTVFSTWMVPPVLVNGCEEKEDLSMGEWNEKELFAIFLCENFYTPQKRS